MTAWRRAYRYVVLTISLGYVATLPGFKEGIEFYMVPDDWSKLFDINVWNDAAGLAGSFFFFLLDVVLYYCKKYSTTVSSKLSQYHPTNHLKGGYF